MNIFLGTELKLSVNILKIGSLSMHDYDWYIDVYTSPKKCVTVKKEDADYITDDYYIIVVDTKQLGQGEVKCKITAEIPDTEVADGFRTEVVIANPDITIINDIQHE